MFSRASHFVALAGCGLVALSLASGCDGGGSGTTTRPDGGGVDTGVMNPGGFMEVGPPDRSDGGTGGLVEALPPPPPPQIVAGAVKVLPAGTEFLGPRGGSVGNCSYGDKTTASGVRWCTFSRPGTSIGKKTIWVVNMSVPGACTATANDNCFPLDGDLFTGQPSAGPAYPSAHRFFGDTLVYHANAKSMATAVYTGPIFAWQPDWGRKSRKISMTDDARRCYVHGREPVVFCLENIVAPETGTVTFDLTAGSFATDPAVLKKVATILPIHPVEVQSSQWNAGFSPDGKYLVYSTGLPPAAGSTAAIPESLFYVEFAKIGTAAPTQTLEAGISRWDISPAGDKWFYLKDFNYSAEAPSGTLWMADFPGGANPVKLSANDANGAVLIAAGRTGAILDYELVAVADPPTSTTNFKLAFVSLVQNFNAGDQTVDYRIIKNPAMPLVEPNVVKALNSVQFFPINSLDRKYAWYIGTRNANMMGLGDVRILRNDGSGSCTLTTNQTSTLFGAPFTSTSSLAFWVEDYNQMTDTGAGSIGDPATCMTKKRKWSSALDYYYVKGDEQVLYTEDVVQGTRSTLKRAAITGGDLGAGTTIQTQVERVIQLLPNQEGVIFRIVSTDENIDGVYLYRFTGGAGADGGVDSGVADAGTGN